MSKNHCRKATEIEHRIVWNFTQLENIEFCLNGKVFMKNLKRKLNELFKGNVQLRKDYLRQSEIDRGEWERRNADIALYETTRHLESQRVEPYQANQCADQAQREKSWLLGELDTRNKRLSGRSRKRLRNTWRITKNLLARSWKSSSIEVWWVLHATEREYFYSESAFGSDSGIARQCEFLERCTRIRWSWNSEQHWIIACSLIHGNHSVHQETLEGLLRTYWVPQETFLKIYLLDTGHLQHSCKTQRIWQQLLADWSQLVQAKLLNKSKNWEELQDCTIPTPRFARSHGTWNPFFRTGGTCYQNCTMDNPRNPSSDLHFDYFPNTEDFQCWKVNFKTEVSSHWGCPTIAMLWIKEVEIAKSVDDLVTSQTIEGRDFNPLECLMRQKASGLKRIISDQHFRRESVSKSSLLKSTTFFFFYEQDRLLSWSVTIFEQLELMMQLKTHQTFERFPCTEMTFKISKQDGIQLHYQQVKHPKKTSWKVCTSWKYEILFSFSLYWHCTNKRPHETTNNFDIPEWRHQ